MEAGHLLGLEPIKHVRTRRVFQFRASLQLKPASPSGCSVASLRQIITAYWDLHCAVSHTDILIFVHILSSHILNIKILEYTKSNIKMLKLLNAASNIYTTFLLNMSHVPKSTK